MKTASPDLVKPQPQELIKTTDQATANLHQKVGEGLQAMGQPNQTVPEHEKPVLDMKDIVESVGHFALSEVEERLSGKGLDTQIRVTPGKRLGRWVLDRARRMKGALQKK